MRTLLAATAVAFLALPTVSSAAVVINGVEAGPDVVFTYSGSIDTTGLGPETLDGGANSGSLFDASTGAILFGNGANMDFWSDISYALPVFGTGFAIADSVTGPGFSIYSDGLGIYDGYVSGDALSGSMTFLGQSFASLGVNAGTYSTSLPSDTVTLNVGQVPLPASLPILGAALGMFGLIRRKRG